MERAPRTKPNLIESFEEVEALPPGCLVLPREDALIEAWAASTPDTLLSAESPDFVLLPRNESGSDIVHARVYFKPNSRCAKS